MTGLLTGEAWSGRFAGDRLTGSFSGTVTVLDLTFDLNGEFTANR